MLESGPAGGALGAVAFGAGRGLADLMAFDMGGTTAKLSVIEGGRPLVTHAFEVARLYRMRPGSGLPVRAPVLDMIEIGAGGGSIAAVDPLGLVTVGPQSAGSEPGPVCYGRGGTRATVTDADLVLGYLGADSFLGGSMPLDLEAAREAIRTQVAEPMGIDVEQAAWGVHATVNENMANAARVHAVERGQDVTRLPLFASGGNGPLHGPGLARALGSPSVLVPPAAGVLSALGFLSAPLSIDLVQSAHTRLRRPRRRHRPRAAGAAAHRGREGADRVGRARRGDRPRAQLRHAVRRSGHRDRGGRAGRRGRLGRPGRGRVPGRVRGALRHRRPARRGGRDPHLAGRLPGHGPGGAAAVRAARRGRVADREPPGVVPRPRLGRGRGARPLPAAARRGAAGPGAAGGARVDPRRPPGARCTIGDDSTALLELAPEAAR